MTAIPGSAGRASRRQAVRSFSNSMRALRVAVLAVVVLAGCSSGDSEGTEAVDTGTGRDVARSSDFESGGESADIDGSDAVSSAEEQLEPAGEPVAPVDVWEVPEVELLDPVGCSDGSWVPAPGVREGLVADCEVLVGLRNGWVSYEQENAEPGVMSSSLLYLAAMGQRSLFEWPGVVAGDRVVELDFGGFGIAGPIPAEIGALTDLRRLDLGLNNLTGPIPAEIGELTELRELNLSDNYLSGPIPAEIGALTELREFRSRGNAFTEIPAEIAGLEKLEDLWIVEGAIAAIPDEIWSITSLRTLGLSNNRLTGTIPPEIGNLVNLEWLDLSDRPGRDGDNQLTGPIPPEIGNLTKLTRLDLSENRLSGSIPVEIGQLGELESLWLFGNRLSGEIPAELGNLGSLVDLDLNDNLLGGSIPSELGNLVSLEGLSLNRNRLVGRIPSELENLVLEGQEGGLDWLTVWENDLCGEIPEKLYRIEHFTFWDNPRLRVPCDEESSGGSP